MHFTQMCNRQIQDISVNALNAECQLKRQLKSYSVLQELSLLTSVQWNPLTKN